MKKDHRTDNLLDNLCIVVVPFKSKSLIGQVAALLGVAFLHLKVNEHFLSILFYLLKGFLRLRELVPSNSIRTQNMCLDTRFPSPHRPNFYDTDL